MSRSVLDDRERKTPGELGERRDRRRVAPGARGDDQRGLRRGEKAGGFVNSILVGARRGCGDTARRQVEGKALKRCGQHFARQ